jgi:hypothetical protein
MNRRTFHHPHLATALLVGLALLLPLAGDGCALIPLATLGTIADIAGDAASTGPTVYKMGKLDIAYLADSTTVERAARQAAYELRLIVTDDPDPSKNPAQWTFKLRDNLGSKITITVEPRTPLLCLCRVDVGVFGSEPTAKLIMTHISSHIPSAPATQQQKPVEPPRRQDAK